MSSRGMLSNRAVRHTMAASAAMAMVMVGCTTGGSDDSEGVTLTLMSHYGNDPLKSGLQEMVDEWNEENPDIQVETEAVSYDDLLQTITVRQTGGNAPDIIQAYSLWGGQLDQAGVLADVPDDIVEDVEANYSPAASNAVTVDDEILGYPTEVQTYALFVNTRLLEEAGVSDLPATWDELEVVAAEATTRDDAGNIDVAGFGLMSGWDSAVVHPFLALMQSAGGEFLDDDGESATFDSEAGRAALQLEQDLIEAGSADPAINVLDGFGSGKVAMAINAGWWIGSLRTEMEDRYSEVEVVPVPGPDTQDTGSLAYGYFMGVNARTQHQDEAWEFLRWLNGEQAEDQATRMGAFQYSVGTIPGRPADSEALADTVDDPNYQPFIDALEYAMPEPNVRSGQQIKTNLQRSIEGVWEGQQMVEEALAEAARQADAELSTG